MANDFLTSVFERLRSRLHGRAARILMSENDADDALQEAFYKLWNNRSKIDSEKTAEGLSQVTLQNVCIDMIRRRQHFVTIDDNSDLPALIDDDDGEAERQALAAEVGSLIERELNQRDRQILIMRDRNGYDFDEIAQIMNINETAVRMALSRARQKVRLLYRNRQQ